MAISIISINLNWRLTNREDKRNTSNSNPMNSSYPTSKTISHKFSLKIIKKKRNNTKSLNRYIKIRIYNKLVESLSIILSIWISALMILVNSLHQSRKKVIESKVETKKIQLSKSFLKKILKIHFLKDKSILVIP